MKSKNYVLGQKVFRQNKDLPENVPVQKIKENDSKNIAFSSVKDMI